MITGAHLICYSRDAEADRRFVQDVLGFPHVDAGRGGLIFALPPAEVAFHPAEESDSQELYLLCDNLDATLAAMASHAVPFTPPTEARWGRVTQLTLPSGGKLGLYQPYHPLALEARGHQGPR